MCYKYFFFNDTATTEIYTLSLHDALPILTPNGKGSTDRHARLCEIPQKRGSAELTKESNVSVVSHTDRKSTRLNSSHQIISYAVFCLKKKKTPRYPIHSQTTV